MPTKRGALGMVKDIEPTPAGCGMRISGSARNCVGLRRNVPSGGRGIDAVAVERNGSF